MTAPNPTKPTSTHEQLMDAAYARWQEHDNKVREDYTLVIKAAIDVLGKDHNDVYALRRQASEKLWSKAQFWAQLDERETIAVLTGNLNYQVCNGGWLQWCDNGFVDCADELEVILRETIGTKTALEVADMVARVSGAWQQFETDKNETPGIAFCRCDDEDDCDCETEDDIWRGAHEEFTHNIEPLDSRFYTLDDQLLADIEKYLNGESLERGAQETTAASAQRIRCKLVGTDGNAFAVIGRVTEALKRGGRKDLVQQFQVEATSGDYNGVLQTAMKYVEVY